MKKIIFALIVMMCVGTVSAQSKIAHVNSTKLLDTLPSRKAAVKTLEDFGNAGEKELQEMETELQKAYEKYIKERETLSKVMQQYEEERLQKKQQAIQMREQELQQQMQKLSGDLNAPILKRLQKAVEIVSDRKKLNYVIDESQALYFKGGQDITSEVMVEILRLDAEETKK